MLNKENNQEQNDLDRAGRLRREADFLEQRQRVRARLDQLLALSKDPYYDQYLSQMIKDLESQRATPAQVEREAERSYQQYRQRMGQKPALPATVVRTEPDGLAAQKFPDGEGSRKHSMEFKIGAHVFSITGAVFVLIAFAIFGMHFLGGMGQGLCLYGTAVFLLLFSEVWLTRRTPVFSKVVTGIAICGVYAANFINFHFLYTINGIVAMSISLLAAIAAVFISRKKDSAALRLVGLFACYVSMLPVQGSGAGLELLMVSVTLFLAGGVSVFFPLQKKQTLAASLHLLFHLVFSTVFTGVAWAGKTQAVYLVLFVVVSFGFVSLLGLKTCRKEKTILFPFCCIGSGIFLFMLFLIGNLGPGVERIGAYAMAELMKGAQMIEPAPDMALFVHLTALTLVTAICGVVFLLWDKEDGRRWVQLYYVAVLLLFFGIFSENRWESLFLILGTLVVVKIASGHKEVLVLDCMVVTVTGLFGIWQTYAWESWPAAGALFGGLLFLSCFRIRHMYLYHEFVVTVSILLTGGIWCGLYLPEEFGGWLCPFSAGTLLILFLLYNHLPQLKEKNQLPYNIISIVFMALYYLEAWMCNSWLISLVMTVLGSLTILIVFRERYSLAIPKKYLLLAGFLVYFALTGHYGQPVAVSIFLMVVALGCVGIGFKIQDRGQRVWGLVMAAVVCLKLVLYDFRELGTVYRVIVFSAVGVMALVISFLYIRLERKRECQGVEEPGTILAEQAESENGIRQSL